jgi:hypothetical protein
MPNHPGLEPQGVAERLHGVLAGVVDTAARQRHPAAHRRDVDDPAAAGRPHARQHQLGQPQQPEHVRLELPPTASIGTSSTGPYSP